MMTFFTNTSDFCIKSIFYLIGKFTILIILTFNAGCGGSSSNSNNGTPEYTVGGEIIGLDGTGLVLQNNNADDLSKNNNGSYTFPNPLTDGSTYSVTVSSHPETPVQVCAVSNGSGTINGNNITNADVFCQTTSTGGSCTSGSIDYDHNLESDVVGVYQSFTITGSIPFTCDSNNNITGSGNLSFGIGGFIQMPCTECIWTANTIIDVNLNGLLSNSVFSIDFDETWYVGSPTGSGSCTDTCDGGTTPFTYPYIETQVQHIEDFPDIYGYTIQSPYSGVGGTYSGTYNYTIYPQ